MQRKKSKRSNPHAPHFETVTCPACQTLNEAQVHVCKKCGHAFGFGNLDPIQTIRSQGSFLRNWIDRPSTFQLAVVWIFHLPLTAGFGFVAVKSFLDRNDLGSLPAFVFFWIGIGGAFFTSAFLYRATKNYLHHRNR